MLTNQMLATLSSVRGAMTWRSRNTGKASTCIPVTRHCSINMGWAYFYNGAAAEGIEMIRNSQAVDGVDPNLSPDLAYIHAMTGKRDQTQRTLNRLLTLARNNPVSPGMIALVYVALDERPQALSWLEKAYHQHSSIMTWLLTD